MPPPVDIAALEVLVTAFERVELTPATFHHREHLLVALTLMSRHPPDEAVERMRTGLAAILARSGHPDAYHETVTQCWMRVLRHRMSTLDPRRPLADRLADVLAWSQDARPLEAHYSPDCLATAEARRTFVPPDRAPLPDVAFEPAAASAPRCDQPVR